MALNLRASRVDTTQVTDRRRAFAARREGERSPGESRMPHRIVHFVALLAAVTCAGSMTLTKVAKAQAQDPIPIAEALKTMKIAEYFTVEGTMSDSANQFIYYIQDDTGKMPVKIQDFLVREHGAINNGDRLRLWGKMQEKGLDHEVHGMLVSQMYRLPSQHGGTGLENPGAAGNPEYEPIDRSALPAAPSIDQADMIEPQASDEFKMRARAALKAYRQAEADAVEAGEAYARAARKPGADAENEAMMLERLQLAEQKVVETRNEVNFIVSEARASGIDEGLVNMIEHEAGMRR